MTDLGVIVHFNDSKANLLNDLIILDPQWLTRLLSTLITTKPNFVKNGAIYSGDLSQIWKPPEFPDSLHPSLLTLLEKFEIAYPLPVINTNNSSNNSNNSNNRQQTQINSSSEQRILIPYLVHSEKPDNLSSMSPLFHENTQRSPNNPQFVRRVYRFDFIPFGFFSRLVVRVLHFMEALSYWKNGILIQSNEGM